VVFIHLTCGTWNHTVERTLITTTFCFTSIVFTHHIHHRLEQYTSRNNNIDQQNKSNHHRYQKQQQQLDILEIESLFDRTHNIVASYFQFHSSATSISIMSTTAAASTATMTIKSFYRIFLKEARHMNDYNFREYAVRRVRQGFRDPRHAALSEYVVVNA
jgi:hypothetical protein